jgi:hypothetical protein
MFKMMPKLKLKPRPETSEAKSSVVTYCYRIDPVMAQWVEALCSGKYIQGKGFLTQVGDDGVERDDCMGVLMKLCNTPRVQSGRIFFYSLSDMSISKHPGIIRLDGHTESLSALNDDGLTFSQLADLIEYAYCKQ